MICLLGVFFSVDHRCRENTTEMGAIDENWPKIVEGEVHWPHFIINGLF